jgi:beta-xylosidase
MMRIALLTLALVLLTSCAAQPTPPPVPSPEAQVPLSLENSYQNPVLDEDFPDPDLLKVGDTWYAYATNAGRTNIQMAYSTDLVTWTRADDALPTMPTWARAGLTWAPEVTTLDGGQTFLMYFVARDIASNRQCIGLATADNPLGPFVDTRTTPFICNPAEGGDIDASSFVDDDGTPWLLWKNDGNCCGMDTWIYMQQLAPDGLSLVGEPVRLIQQDLPWEGNLVEAPTLWKQEGRYYLFYSANSYADNRYAIGYAVADAPTGPYVKNPNRLAYSSKEQGTVTGPGGQDVVVGPSGRTFLIYHSWADTMGYRRMNIDELHWEDGVPSVSITAGIPQLRP